jgi:hypothetical protein
MSFILFIISFSVYIGRPVQCTSLNSAKCQQLTMYGFKHSINICLLFRIAQPAQNNENYKYEIQEKAPHGRSQRYNSQV